MAQWLLHSIDKGEGTVFGMHFFSNTGFHNFYDFIARTKLQFGQLFVHLHIQEMKFLLLKPYYHLFIAHLSVSHCAHVCISLQTSTNLLTVLETLL